MAVSTGEPSGRLYAALVEAALYRHEPAARIVRLEAGRSRSAILGFAEGIRSAPALRHALAADRRCLAALSPDLVLLVGFSNYNLVLGRHCRRSGIRVVFLAPPQLWAWGAWRVGFLRRAADLVLCLFAFEAEWLRARGVRAEFLGNPLTDHARFTTGRARTLARLGFTPADRYVAFLSGSRPAERDWHLWVFEQVDTGTRQRVFVPPDGQLTGPGAEPGTTLAASVRRYDLLAHADAAVVVSGTAALETALLGTPQVVCYHLSPVTRMLARLLVRTRWFALPNILLGRNAVPELLEPTPVALGRALGALLAGSGSAARFRADAAELEELLGPAGAADRIAGRLLGL